MLRGWSRRFWQGSHDHRGVPDAPGRVVTLIEAPRARCVGVAYAIEHDAFEHLDHREKNGYARRDVEIELPSGHVDAVVYVAAPGNVAYLGPAAPLDIARQIAASRGPSGSNREYLVELARALRNLDAPDEHVFELEALLDRVDTNGHRALR